MHFKCILKNAFFWTQNAFLKNAFRENAFLKNAFRGNAFLKQKMHF